MATEGECMESLCDFLQDSFKPSDLNRFLIFKGYGKVAATVNPNVGGIDYSFNVVQALNRRGLIDAGFFQRLREELPRKEARIVVLQESWLAKAQDEPPAPLDQPSVRPFESHPLKVFYSYSQKDEKLRDQLATFLQPLVREGLIEDWYDRRIAAGTEWEAQIDDRLKSAEIILLLVSSNFVASRYCYDLEMKTALMRSEKGEAWVIPIILRPSDWQSLPFHKLQCLPKNGKPVTSWQDRNEAFLDIARGIRAVVDQLRNVPSPPAQPILSSTPEIAAQPTPSFNSPTVKVLLETGIVPVDSVFYESRSAEELAARYLEWNDPTVIVRGSRQSGKSSLLTRLHFQALDAGQQSCYLNLEDVDDSSLENSGTLFLEFARMMADELRTTVDPDETWSKKRGVKQNLTKFLQDAILNPCKSSFVLLFDEVDLVFEHEDCRTDLFTMIRSWHDRRPKDRTGAWKKLRLVIAHATDPALWIPNLNQSPFNVGHKVELDDFDRLQIDELNRKHGKPLKSEKEVHSLMELVGGHPFLVRLAFYTLVTRPCTIAVLNALARDAHGPFASHLNYYYSLISKNPKLRTALRQVVYNGKCRDEEQFQHLWAAGLIRGASRDQVAMRCQLYHDYFKERL
jgi:hypothetical protein